MGDLAVSRGEMARGVPTHTGKARERDRILVPGANISKFGVGEDKKRRGCAGREAASGPVQGGRRRGIFGKRRRRRKKEKRRGEKVEFDLFKTGSSRGSVLTRRD